MSSTVKMEHWAYWALKFLNFDPLETVDKSRRQLLELEEMCLHAYDSSKKYKENVKFYHDKKLVKKVFHPVKINGVSDEAIRLSLFPFCLGGNAKMWVNSFPENSFTRWEDVVAKFLNKYFPQSKVNNKGKQEISSFQ
ncbi:uncharacterized protein LOC108344378 [Vigna angularis]|uniref:uncharacterized protein LOC108344378 n=1 Tax=Phaseolus angularis TaxID=3914 RepID=UPI000809B861|nr:uncharacterized protein LOC108344378 [Vigna angularis]